MISTGQLEQNQSCRQFLTTSTDESGRYHFDGVRLAFYVEIDYWGTGIAPGRESILLPVDASQPTKFDFRAQRPPDWLSMSIEEPGRRRPKSGSTRTNRPSTLEWVT